jgi:antitoxin component YwqK of YwqJK toxin-antitoxin module
MNPIVNSAKKIFPGIILFMFFPVFIFGQDTLQKGEFKQFHYENGTLSSEGYLRNGNPDGYWKSYYENGILKSEGNRKDFLLDGTWRFYDEQGKLYLKVTYREGKKNGIKCMYLDKEIIHENFADDIKEGFTLYFREDSTLVKEIPFFHGMEQGFGREYSPEGRIITLTEYRKGFIVSREKINRADRDQKKQGKWMTFWPNGKIRTECTYKDDQKNGYYKEYAENGNLIRIEKYLSGELQKEAVEVQKLTVDKTYYPDGTVQTVTMYRNGIPEGIKKYYDPAGGLEKAEEYRNGSLAGEGSVTEDGTKTGYWKEYYSGGKIKAEGKYEKGKPAGQWKYYHENGTLEQTGVYTADGKPDGIWKWYFESGGLLREETYYRGLKDGISEEYDEQGLLVEQGEYLEGFEDGPWMIRVGDNCQKGFFTDGLRNGIWYSYIVRDTLGVTDSLLVFRGRFIDDLPDGKHTYYWENGNKKKEGIYVMGRQEGNWIMYNSDETIFMIITYQNGVETKFDGVRIKPPFEQEE